MKRTFTREEKIQILEREIKYRARVYSRLISSGKLSREDAEFQYLGMAAILADYKGQGDLFAQEDAGAAPE